MNKALKVLCRTAGIAALAYAGLFAVFYFDLDASVYSPAFARLIEELDVTLEQFTYLGSYSELA